MMNERLTKNGVDKKCAKLQLKRVVSALLITSKVDEEEGLYTERSFAMTKILKGKNRFEYRLGQVSCLVLLT